MSFEVGLLLNFRIVGANFRVGNASLFPIFGEVCTGPDEWIRTIALFITRNPGVGNTGREHGAAVIVFGAGILSVAIEELVVRIHRCATQAQEPKAERNPYPETHHDLLDIVRKFFQDAVVQTIESPFFSQRMEP